MVGPNQFFGILETLMRDIANRSGSDVDDSYTARLLAEGKDAIADKVTEEATEVAIEAMRGDKDGVTREAADLLYHLLVLCYASGASEDLIQKEIKKRRGKSGLQEKAERKEPEEKDFKQKSPVVFVSYSHDSDEHKNWVLQLATRLRANGVNTILDHWNLSLGQNLANFMEQGLTKANRVLCICSDSYVEKANAGIGGTGYEKQIIATEILSDLNTKWIIPIIKNNNSKKMPTCLGGRVYNDFTEDALYEKKYEELLRELLDEPVLPAPALGENPFKNIKKFEEQNKFTPHSEKYVSPAMKGTVTFDYSNNNGRYSIGQNELLFELKFRKSSDTNIQIYDDPPSIKSVALVKDKTNIADIDDARGYNFSSRVRRPQIGQIAVLQNSNGYYACIKIIAINDDTRSSEFDEVTFDYIIQTNGSPDFTSLKKES